MGLSGQYDLRFTVRDCDHYLMHIAALGAGDGDAATATEDIKSEFDIVVMERFAKLRNLEAEAWQGRSLQRPIDTLFEVPHRLNSVTLLGCFHELLHANEDLAATDAHFGFDQRLRHLCHTTPLPLALLQKLTVLRAALPQVFQRTLFVTWLGALIALERKLDADATRLVFVAGLCHDLGLLHINPALVDKKRDIQVDEWQQIQMHVGIGAEIAASFELGEPRLPLVIAQHHERCDGAGYPAGRRGDELDPLGQILALGDMLYALRFQGRRTMTQTLADCMPYLRVNLRTFGEENCEAAERVILGAHGAPERRSPQGFLLEDLIGVNDSLRTLLGELRAVRPQLATLKDSRPGASLVSLIEQIQWVSLSSGIGNEAIEGWLRKSIDDPEASGALEDVLQTATEVYWLVHRVERQLQALRAAQPLPEALERLAGIVAAQLADARHLFDPAPPA